MTDQPMEERAHHQCDGRLHEEFKRRIKTQTVLPSAETAAMLFWALLATGQITMRKVDGWQTLSRQSRNQRGDRIVRRCQSCREPDDGVAHGAL
jgi:hypothetical protein